MSEPIRGGDQVRLIGDDAVGIVVKIRDEGLGFEYNVKWKNTYAWHQKNELVLIKGDTQ